MTSREEYKNRRKAFNDLIENKGHSDIKEIAFDLYSTNLKQELKLIKHNQFLDIINCASSSFSRIDFSNSKL